MRRIAIDLVKIHTCDSLARSFAAGLAAEPLVALARVWLLEQDGCLHLQGSAGTPQGGGSYSRLDGEFSCIPIGHGKIGAIAATGEARVVRGLRGDEDWLSNSSWVARQNVRTFVAYPLRADDRVVGVLALFDRRVPPDATLEDIAFLADLAAARLADLAAHGAGRPPSLPATSVPASDLRPPGEGRRSPGGTEVITRSELRAIEKRNIEIALRQTDGKIFGAKGAAAILGMKPTTLASRIKALRIHHP